MLVLIEGIDRSGKTALADALRRRRPLDTDVVHFGPPTQGALDEYVTPLLGYRPGGRHVVLDRGHVGEAVWPEFFGREPAMTGLQRRWIELFMLSRGALYIHTQRDAEGLEAAWDEAEAEGRPEPLDRGLIGAALVRYDEEMAGAAPPIARYEHTHMADLLPRIADAADNYSDFAEPGIAISADWIGNHRPAALLVASGEGPLGLPAPEAGGDFDRLLTLAGPQWREVAVAAPLAPREMRDLWAYLGRPAVTTSGQLAADACRELPQGDEAPF